MVKYAANGLEAKKKKQQNFKHETTVHSTLKQHKQTHGQIQKKYAKQFLKGLLQLLSS